MSTQDYISRSAPDFIREKMGLLVGDPEKNADTLMRDYMEHLTVDALLRLAPLDTALFIMNKHRCDADTLNALEMQGVSMRVSANRSLTASTHTAEEYSYTVWSFLDHPDWWTHAGDYQAQDLDEADIKLVESIGPQLLDVCRSIGMFPSIHACDLSISHSVAIHFAQSYDNCAQSDIPRVCWIGLDVEAHKDPEDEQSYDELRYQILVSCIHELLHGFLESLGYDPDDHDEDEVENVAQWYARTALYCGGVPYTPDNYPERLRKLLASCEPAEN